mgnify:CR=1 FL=1
MSIHIRDKLLGNNSLQYHGQLDGNLSLLGWFEYIYDTTDRVCCSGGVKTGENEDVRFRQQSWQSESYS